MDENTDLLDQDVEGTEQDPGAGEASPDDSPVVRRLKKENQGLRQRLRRTELRDEYKGLVDLIPDELPMSKWEDWLGKAKELIPVAPETTQVEQATEDEAPEAPTPQEINLAAAAQGSASASPGAVEMSPKDIRELGKRDPAAAMRQIKQQYRAP